MEQEANKNEPYSLTTDPALLAAAESDQHLALLLEGYSKANEIAARRPDDPAAATVAQAAEQGLRGWIAQQGYGTLEPPAGGQDAPE